ncbi:MAG TPA: TolC family protein [Gemmatimonadaceae bacterium]|jgi:outer membrane protein TolC|nr:TolC family protein [Gemmatimonadaceae bacterium]
MTTSFRVLSALLLIGAASTAAAQDSALARPLTLGDAARLGARQNASALEARARTAQAAARITQTRSDLLPTVSGYAAENGRSYNSATFGITFPGFDANGEVIGPVNIFDVRAKISETLFDFGALQRLKSARTTARAFGATAANEAELAAQSAANAYLRAQRADAQLGARVADSVLADSLLSIANEELRAGVGVALDVTRAKSQFATIRAQLIVARNERDRAKLDLLRALGQPLTANVSLADSLNGLVLRDTTINEPDAIDVAMRTRPDLRAADEQIRAAEQEVTAIKAERLPSLSAFGDYGYIGKDRLLGTYDWGVQVSIPIFDGLRREGRIEEAKAISNEIDVRRRDLRQQAAIEVRGALLDLASAKEEAEAVREALRLAQQEVSQAQERFRAGVAGNADVFTASLSLNSARTQAVDALSSYQSAKVALARAVGSVTALP